MENICHTLFGAVLAKAGLERKTPLAMPTLLIAANLPDMDIVMALNGSLAYLKHHRGITHSLLGVLCLSVLLAVGMYGFDRLLLQRFRSELDRARLGWLVVLSLIGVASHPLLDYTNSYGVRPFLPWNSQWIYGDIVFVLDPWLWLILGSAVFLLTSQTRKQMMAWAALATLMALVVTGAAISILQSRGAMPLMPWLWFVGVGSIIGARWYGLQRHGSKLAWAALLATVTYWSFLGVAHSVALRHVQSASRTVTHDQPTMKHAALPRPATPFMWDAFFETSTDIYYGVVSTRKEPDSSWKLKRLPKRLDDPMVQRALTTCAGATMFEFGRYLFAEVDQTAAPPAVILRDARYERGRKSGFAAMTIPIDPNSKQDDCGPK